MILAIVLAALLLLFILVRHNVGVPFLAMIAGYAVYQAWGLEAARVLADWIPGLQVQVMEYLIYGALVLGFPLLLYMRSGKSGLFGALRILESVVFAIVLVILISEPLSSIFAFDTLAYNISVWLDQIRGIAMIVGISFAYVDVFLFHSGKVW
ncbi:hypothetical protein J6X13_03730 [Candidatus Saccharibacteria bacterium]|nr:hypothetical protein [Candidatus Saccharibacteria bacterium]